MGDRHLKFYEARDNLLGSPTRPELMGRRFASKAHSGAVPGPTLAMRSGLMETERLPVPTQASTLQENTTG